MDNKQLSSVAQEISDKILQYAGRQSVSFLEKGRILREKHSTTATFTLNFDIQESETQNKQPKLINKDLSLKNFTSKYEFISTIALDEGVDDTVGIINSNQTGDINDMSSILKSKSTSTRHIRQDIAILKSDYINVSLTNGATKIAEELMLYDFEYAVDKLEAFDLSEQEAAMTKYQELHDLDGTQNDDDDENENEGKKELNDEIMNSEYKNYNDNEYYANLPDDEVNIALVEHKLRVHHTLYHPFGTRIDLPKNCLFLLSVRWKQKIKTQSQVSFRHHRKQMYKRKLISDDDGETGDEDENVSSESTTIGTSTDKVDQTVSSKSTSVGTSTDESEGTQKKMQTETKGTQTYFAASDVEMYDGDFTMHDLHAAEIYYNAGDEIESAEEHSDKFFQDINKLLKSESKYSQNDQIEYYQTQIASEVTSVRRLHDDLISNSESLLLQHKKLALAHKQETASKKRGEANHEIQLTLERDIKEEEAQIQINQQQQKIDLSRKLKLATKAQQQTQIQLDKVEKQLEQDSSDLKSVDSDINRLQFEHKRAQENVALWLQLDRQRKKYQKETQAFSESN